MLWGWGRTLPWRRNKTSGFKGHDLLESWDDYLLLEKDVNSRIFVNAYSVKHRRKELSDK